ncbi:unnamed protein product [Caenorhabditis nigoni]
MAGPSDTNPTNNKTNVEVCQEIASENEATNEAPEDRERWIPYEPRQMSSENQKVLLPLSKEIRRPRRQNNYEDVDYSKYLEILNTKHAALGELKRCVVEDSGTDAPEMKKMKMRN